MRLLGIDPGPTQSGFLVWDDCVIEAAMLSNWELRQRLKENNFGGAELVGIEMVQSFGLAVGKEVFETVRWVGILQECSVPPVRLVYRKDVKMHLCHSMRAKDANIRAALIDLYGPVGTKKNKGKLWGVSGHLWSALAIASYLDSPNERGVIQHGAKHVSFAEIPETELLPLP